MSISSGKTVRLNRLFNPVDGKAVCVAADHGWMSDPTPNVMNLRKILEKVVQGNPDGILVSFGTAMRMTDLFCGKGSPALIIRADWMNMPRLGGSNTSNILPVTNFKKKATSFAKDALLMGASAITIYYFIGYSDEFEALNIEQNAFFAKECRKIGLPIIIEPMAVGGAVTGVNIAETLIASARIAVELGADALKIPYTGDIKTFAKLVDEAGMPVLVLGGAKSDNPRDALELVDEAMQAGASGTVFGRNVTKASDPRQMVADIVDLVHRGKSVDEIVGKRAYEYVRLKAIPANCTGCQICVISCQAKHLENYGNSRARLKIKIDYGNGEPQNSKPVVCTLCEKCVSVCPTTALTINDHGYLTLNPELCTRCGDCVKACSFNVIWQDADGVPVFCDLCQGDPQCVRNCPSNALELIQKVRI